MSQFKIEPGFRWEWQSSDKSRKLYGITFTEEEAKLAIENQEDHWSSIQEIEAKERLEKEKYREKVDKAKEGFLQIIQPLFIITEKVYGREETIDALWETVEEIQ